MHLTKRGSQKTHRNSEDILLSSLLLHCPDNVGKTVKRCPYITRFIIPLSLSLSRNVLDFEKEELACTTCCDVYIFYDCTLYESDTLDKND